MRTKIIFLTFICWATSILNAQTFHDAAAFHLNGNVKEATIFGSKYYFSEQGELLGGIINEEGEILSPVHTNNFLRSIVIKEPNQFCDGGFLYRKLVFDKYDLHGRLTLAKEYRLDRYMKNPQWTDDYYYEYDSYGLLISETQKSKTTDGPYTHVTEFYNTISDSHGNVLKCETRNPNGGDIWHFTREGEFAYWDEPTPMNLSIYEMISYPFGIKNKSIFTKTTEEVKDLYPNWSFLISECPSGVKKWDYVLKTGKQYGYNLKYHNLIPFVEAWWKRGQRRNILSWRYEFLGWEDDLEDKQYLTNILLVELKSIGCKLIKSDVKSNGKTYELRKGQLYIKLYSYDHGVTLHIDKYHLTD